MNTVCKNYTSVHVCVLRVMLMNEFIRCRCEVIAACMMYTFGMYIAMCVESNSSIMITVDFSLFVCIVETGSVNGQIKMHHTALYSASVVSGTKRCSNGWHAVTQLTVAI